MPIVNTKPKTSKQDNVVTDVSDRQLYTEKELQVSTMFGDEIELSNITKYISGKEWGVNYFNQELTSINDKEKPFDIGLTHAEQSYNRISELVIYLEGGISFNESDNNVTGTGVIYAGGIRPYRYDMFLATVAGNREALFEIKTTDKLMYNKKEMYRITFGLITYLDASSEIYLHLLGRVNKEYVYDRNYIFKHNAPVVLAEDYVKSLDIQDEYNKLVNYYLNTFVNKEKQLIVPPVIEGIHYDSILVDFIKKTIDLTDYNAANKINLLTNEYDGTYNVLDAVLKRDIDMLVYVDRNVGFKPVGITMSHPFTRPLVYLGVTAVTGIVDTVNRVTPTYLINSRVKPIDLAYEEPIKTPDDNYIFSLAFYNNDSSGCGSVERAILMYMRKELVDQNLLADILKGYLYWDFKQQFYLLPLVIMLLKDHTLSRYSKV